VDFAIASSDPAGGAPSRGALTWRPAQRGPTWYAVTLLGTATWNSPPEHPTHTSPKNDLRGEVNWLATVHCARVAESLRGARGVRMHGGNAAAGRRSPRYLFPNDFGGTLRR
jgi:hypothetical protein